MAQLMRGSLDVVPPFPEILEVKGMKKLARRPEVVDRLSRDQAGQSQLDVEGDFVYHDTEFGQIIRTNYQRALHGQHVRRRRDGGRPEAGPGAGRPRLLARSARRAPWHTSASRRPLRARGRQASAGTARAAPASRSAYRPDPPDRHLRGVFLLYPMYEGLKLSLEDTAAISGSQLRPADPRRALLGHRQGDPRVHLLRGGAVAPRSGSAPRCS